MIYLNKILPVFLLPIGFSLLCLLAALVWRKWKLCAVALIVLWLASLPLVSNAAMRWVEDGAVRLTPEEMPEATAIVVLSGEVRVPPGDNDVLELGEAIDRFEGGMVLHAAGKAPYLIFTGGLMPWQPGRRPEGEVLAEWAIARGVPREDILLTGNVVNTAGEAHAVAALLAQEIRGDRTVLLVTSAFHMRRAVLLFEKAGLEAIPYPVDFRVQEGNIFTIIDLFPSGAGLAYTELALREIYGYWFYRLMP